MKPSWAATGRTRRGTRDETTSGPGDSARTVVSMPVMKMKMMVVRKSCERASGMMSEWARLEGRPRGGLMGW